MTSVVNDNDELHIPLLLEFSVRIYRKKLLSWKLISNYLTKEKGTNQTFCKQSIVFKNISMQDSPNEK